MLFAMPAPRLSGYKDTTTYSSKAVVKITFDISPLAERGSTPLLQRLHMILLSSYNLGLSLLVLVIYFLMKRVAGKRRQPLPPGPPGLPILGNVHQLYSKDLTSVLDQWFKTYGPLVHAKLFGQDVIIISSTRIAKDLMDGRSKIYSDRPRFIMASEEMHGGMMMPFTPINDRYRKVRNLLTAELRPANLSQYACPIQTAEAHRLVKCMMDDTENWMAHISRCTTSIVTTLSYDKPIRSGEPNSEHVNNMIRLNHALGDALESGKNYVDLLPWLKHIPWMPYKRVASDYYSLSETTYKAMLDEVRAKLASGQTSSSVASRFLEKAQEVNYREQYWALGTLYLAGADSTTITFQRLILALASHPEIMKKAQAEIDCVVGNDRLPNFQDEPNLHYVKAVMKESSRWRPVGPALIPHASTEDDVYEGYFIPKGSTVLGNVWSMHMDENTFQDPHLFQPQRYLDHPDLPLHTFGFGRRACPGQRFSELTMLMQICTLLWTCNLGPAIDSNRKQIPIDTKRETAFFTTASMKPKPFRISVTPRSKERAKLLALAVENEGL